MPADTVKHAPERIWATVNGMSTRLPDGARQFIGGWSEDPDRDRVTEYVRADLCRAPDPVREKLVEALDRIFSYVSYVNIHGVGDQPEPNGHPQPLRVPPDEFWRIFQEIGSLASGALAVAEGSSPALLAKGEKDHA